MDKNPYEAPSHHEERPTTALMARALEIALVIAILAVAWSIFRVVPMIRPLLLLVALLLIAAGIVDGWKSRDPFGLVKAVICIAIGMALIPAACFIDFSQLMTQLAKD